MLSIRCSNCGKAYPPDGAPVRCEVCGGLYDLNELPLIEPVGQKDPSKGILELFTSRGVRASANDSDLRGRLHTLVVGER